jgi:hypothetical protein
MERDKQLRTADLARARDEMRGRGEEQIDARERRDMDAPGRGAAQAPQPVRSGPAADPRDTAAARGAAARQQTPAPHVTQTTQSGRPEGHQALFPEHEAAEFHRRWTDVQAGFVDEPRSAVERADSLVAEVMHKLAEGFAGERAALERQWDRGDNVTTEDLRVTLQRYRSFFDRLLKI